MDKIKKILKNIFESLDTTLFAGIWHIACLFAFAAYLMYTGVLTLLPACWMILAVVSGEEFIMRVLRKD